MDELVVVSLDYIYENMNRILAVNTSFSCVGDNLITRCINIPISTFINIPISTFINISINIFINLYINTFINILLYF